MSAATSIDLLFPKRLYALAAVKKAAAIYNEDADLQVEKTDEGYRISGTAHDPEALEELIGELGNTALYYTIETRKKF